MHEIPLSATGRLREFCEAGLIGLPDFHLARRLSRGFERDDDVVLAFALAVRELRLGSVCLPLTTAHTLKPDTDSDDGRGVTEIPDLRWPEPHDWIARVAKSPLVGDGRPFTLVDDLLYLSRFHAVERQVADALERRRALPQSDAIPALPGGKEPDAQQDAAVAAALRHPTSVITGGPGTGKTTTVVRILNSLGARSPISIALAAPTGKAARQLHDSVTAHLDPAAAKGTPFAGTLHRLLGLSVRGNRAVHDAANPLPYDVVVVDEVSMVALEQMAALLDAVGPGTRLLLVGDPQQLRSVEAGAVLADIVDNPALTQPGSVVRLATNHRSNQDITALAAAIDGGDIERANQIVDTTASISWFDYEGRDIRKFETLRDDVLGQARDIVAAASDGDARSALQALERHRILCAHRLGPYGVQGWAKVARELIASSLPGYGRSDHYVGKPLLITQNTDVLSNGDVAVLVMRDGELVAAVDQRSTQLLLPPILLDDAADLHAMTVHKAQGGQYDTVTVVLPPVGSPLATRELLYTAVTRARSAVRIYGTRAAFAEAIRTPVRRASGLARR